MDLLAHSSFLRAYSRGASAATCGFCLALLVTSGCGNNGLNAVVGPVSSMISGEAHGGQQPISGATVQLYAVGTAGDGSLATPLLTTTELTNSQGQFNLQGYKCPTPSTNVYLTVTGGNPGLKSGTNSNIATMVALGPCGNITASTYLSVNELSTIAAAFALAPFMQGYNSVGSGAMDSDLLSDAFVTAGRMVNTATAAIPGPGLQPGESVAATKFRALANSVSTCINSSGGAAGDGTSCGTLFSLTTPASLISPTDTVGAILNIANNPTSEVVPIFILSPPVIPFSPALASAPIDWNLGLTSSTPTPSISPVPGNYSSPTMISLSDSAADAQIYYTTDGSTPTNTSYPYSGSFSLSTSGLIRAIAYSAGIGSLLVAADYTIQPPHITLTPSNVTLRASQFQVYSAVVTGLLNTNVSWSLNPAVGSISPSGVYTAPSAVSAAQTVYVTSTSVLDASANATAAVTLVPDTSVSVTPGLVILTPSQTTTFSAAILNASNTAVTWSVNPTIGTISTSGVYTAPATIASTQSIAVTATSVADTTKSGTAMIFVNPGGATYYISPAGNDYNLGSISAPWATPNHALNCGDKILAAPGTYPQLTNFGPVTCPAGDNIAWLICQTAFSCKVNVTSGNQYSSAIEVAQSFWGVQGWVASTGAGMGQCFQSYPATSGKTIHHIVFANDVCNGAGQGGFGASNNGAAGVDYLAYVGDVAYNSAQGSVVCASAFNTFKPVASDTLPGTHIYYGGDFAIATVEGNPCAGGAPTDGEGFFFDTTQPYMQQMVMDNSISIFNGGNGAKTYNNSNGSIGAPTYFRQLTTYGNETASVSGGICSEIGFENSLSSSAYRNLAVTATANGCSWQGPLYALAVSNANATDQMYDNFIYSASGSSLSSSGGGFSWDVSNLLGANPNLTNPVLPPAPNCGGYSTVAACMGTVVANFEPKNPAASGYGYQTPGTSPVYDPLFPKWLCNVNLPAGLVTMGCLKTP